MSCADELPATATGWPGEDGAAGGAGANDAMYARRFGLPVPGSPTTLGVAASTSADCTAAGVAAGFCCRYSAATPATCGVAMEVPEIVTVAVGEVHHAEVIDCPGAKMSTHGPQFENDARMSFDAVAPTVMAVGSLAGDFVQASELSLPAATAKVIPSRTPLATALLMAEVAVPPRDMLATAGTPAWWSRTTQSIEIGRAHV